jgi:hypothetical protein
MVTESTEATPSSEALAEITDVVGRAKRGDATAIPQGYRTINALHFACL